MSNRITDFVTNETIKSAYKKYGWLTLHYDVTHLYAQMTEDEYVIYVAVPALTDAGVERMIALRIFAANGVDISDFMGLDSVADGVALYRQHYKLFVDTIEGFKPEEARLTPTMEILLMTMGIE
jgi:hypothetical protein